MEWTLDVDVDLIDGDGDVAGSTTELGRVNDLEHQRLCLHRRTAAMAYVGTTRRLLEQSATRALCERPPTAHVAVADHVNVKSAATSVHVHAEST